MLIPAEVIQEKIEGEDLGQSQNQGQNQSHEIMVSGGVRKRH